ncbi:MAG: hypothetical protein QM820_09520 [Minicystis sp.]
MKTNIFSARSPLSIASLVLSWTAMSLGGCAVPTDDQGAAGPRPEVVAEAQQAVSFPGSSSTTLGNTTTYEPSGLALLNGTLYMASDKDPVTNTGKIAKYNASTNQWSTEYSGAYDFESLTVASGQLMVGVEGSSSASGSSNNAKIYKFDAVNKTLPQSWRLNAVSGMEAMTFVPEAYTPYGQANTTAHPSAFDGYFFIATQNDPGLITVYRLDSGSSTATWIDEYTIDITMQASDMSFANGCLYVLFDENTTSDQLAVYIINTNPSNKMLAYQKQYDLPSVGSGTPSDANYEGITFNGQTIYLARDDNNSNANNFVKQYSNTIIYPQTVLPPLSW